MTPNVLPETRCHYTTQTPTQRVRYKKKKKKKKKVNRFILGGECVNLNMPHPVVIIKIACNHQTAPRPNV